MGKQKRKEIVRSVAELLELIGYGRWKVRGFSPQLQDKLDLLRLAALNFFVAERKSKRQK